MKRWLCMMLIAAMVLSSVGMTVMADDATVHYSMHLSGDVTVGTSVAASVTKETYRSADGTYSAAEAVTGVTWSSSDGNVLTIDKDGTVTGKKVGTAVITAKGTGFTLSMLAIVTLDGATTGSAVNYDSKTAGNYTRSTNSAQATSVFLDLPYSLTSAPAHGGTGLSLYLNPLKKADYTSKGLAAGSANYMEHPLFTQLADESDKTIRAGKVTEFWWYFPENNSRTTWYLRMYMPCNNFLKFSIFNKNTNYPHNLIGLSSQRGTGIFTAGTSQTGYGGQTAFANYGWNQVVIDASKVDASTGVGTYSIYFNGVLVGTVANTTAGNVGGRIVFNRDINLSASVTEDSGTAYFDDFKMYEMVEPEEVENTLELGEGGSVVINAKTYSSGGKIAGLNERDVHTITVRPKVGYQLDSITYNETAVSDGTFKVVKDGVLKVTFKAEATKDETTEYTLSADKALSPESSAQLTLTTTKSRVAVSSKRQITDEPKDVTSGAIFESSDSSIVTVDENGVATGHAVGTAKITALVDGKTVASMLAVVSGSVVTETGYDDASLPQGEQQETLASLQGGNAETTYEYVSSPRLGMSGKSLQLHKVPVTNIDKYSFLTATSGYNWIEKTDVFPDGGKSAKGTITELWVYNSRTAVSKGSAVYLKFGSHSLKLNLQNQGTNLARGEFGKDSHKQWWAGSATNVEYANNTSPEVYSNSFAYPFGWSQLVIDGTEILENGGVVYKLYINGNFICKAAVNPSGEYTVAEGMEAISVIRTLYNNDTDSSDLWIDGYKVYSMDIAPYVSSVKVTGKNEVNSHIEAHYVFSKGYGTLKEDDAAVTTQWYSSDMENGTYEPLQGKTEESLSLTSAMLGKWLKFGVTLKGKTSYSSPVRVLEVGGTNVDSALYVSTDGSDSNDGSKDAPFATLEKARDTIRKYRENDVIPDGGITVYLREGTYQLSRTFALTLEDSGTKDKPITYAAYPGEKVSLTGGATMDLEKFSAIDGEMKEKLSSDTAKENVIVAKLSDFGLETPAKYTLSTSSYNAPMILYDGQAMQLAKYPNSSVKSEWMKCDVLNRGKCNRYSASDYRQGTGLMKFKYYDEDEARIESWTVNTDEIIYNGYWGETWINEVIYGTMDKAANTIEATAAMTYGGAAFLADGKTTVSGIGAPYGINYYAMNVFEELDEPGEYYIDRTTGKLYLYPSTDNPNAEIKMSNLDGDLISVTGASYITFDGIELTSGRRNGISISLCNSVIVSNCDLNSFEKQGFVMENSSDSKILDSHIHQNGAGAMTVSACGSRDEIFFSYCYITNNEIHDNTVLNEYANQITVTDCIGLTIDHNEIYNTPHIAINFSGTENIIEYNYIHHAVTNTADSGAIYTGRHWDDHGNVIRYNHFSDLGNARKGMLAAAFFTDDGSSDCDVYGNVFGPGLDNAHVIKVHAGQNNNFRDNLFIDTPYFYYAYIWDNAKWARFILEENTSDSSSYRDRLLAVASNPLYVERWSWVQDAFKEAGDIQHLGNTFEKNLIVMIDNELRGGNKLRMDDNGPVANFGNDEALLYGWEDENTNTILLNQSKDIFADYDHGDYTIVDESVLPEYFHDIEFSMIGLLEQADLTKWLNQAKTLKKNATVGTNIGDYPQDTVSRLTAAIKDAESGNGSVSEMAILLYDTINNMELQRICQDSTTASEYTLPEKLDESILNVGNVQNGFTLALKGQLGSTRLTGYYGEQEFTAEIPSGTEASSNEIFMSRPATNSAGADLKNEVVLTFGDSATVFSKPIRMVLPGMGKMRIFYETAGTLKQMQKLENDDRTALKDGYGYVRNGDDLIVWMNRGGEIALATGMTESGSGQGTVTPISPSTGTGTSSGGTTGGTTVVGTGGGSNGSSGTKASAFTDIIGHWAEKDITTMVNKGIVSGVTATTFEPDRAVTRAEFAALVVRTLKLTAVNAESVFDDVSDDAWYAKEVTTAASAGLVAGYDGCFRPDDTITREEMAVVIMKAYAVLGKQAVSGTLEQFADQNEISDWARDFVAKAVGTKLMFGMTDSEFAPKANATRAQATSILLRVLNQ